MIDMHSKYDNMHKNGMFYALICINNRIIACYQKTLLSFLPLVVMSVLEEIQSSSNGVDTARGQTLKWPKELL